MRPRLAVSTQATEPGFGAILAGLTNSATAPAAALDLQTDVGAIYDAMLAAIAAARRSVTFETYLFRDGRIAERFVRAFVERAVAGVPVKVLLDAQGSHGLARDTLARLHAAGVEVRFFRRFDWRRPIGYNHRTHRKILVVDGRVALTGGIGVADMWAGPPPWCELGLRVEGPAAALLQGAFFQDWSLAGGALDLGPAYFPATGADAGGPLAMVTTSAPAWGGSMVGLLLLAAIAAATHRLTLVSPYFLPGRAIAGALADAAARGVAVRLLLPGPHNDNPLAYHASRRLYAPLLACGVRIWEYGPAMMHAKALAVDGIWASVGSANVDPRSIFLNSELNVSVRDPGLAGAVEAFADGAIAACTPVRPADLARDRWPGRLLGGLGLALRTQL